MKEHRSPLDPGEVNKTNSPLEALGEMQDCQKLDITLYN